MMRDLAIAINDLATLGRLSEESEENIRFLIEPPAPVSDEHVELVDTPTDAPPATPKSTTASGGKK